MNPRIHFALSVFVITTLLLGSCSARISESTPTIGSFPTASSSSIRTLTPTRTKFTRLSPTPTFSPATTWTASSTETPAPSLPAFTPAYLGTPVAPVVEEINSNNINRLTRVAEWGKGEILGVVFAPDDSFFIVASAFGFAMYDPNNLEEQPTWSPFDIPVNFYDISISSDGKYLRLISAVYISFDQMSYTDEYFTIPEGNSVKEPDSVTWFESTVTSKSWGEMILDSPKGTMQLITHSESAEYGLTDYSIREVYAEPAGNLLYKLPDETFYLTYNDIHQPEGCDLYSSAMCGNVYDPSAFHPYQAAFAPDEDTLTILYRAPNYGNSNRYSVLRIYDASTGHLMDMVGNYSKPIQTFAYEPDGKRLLVAFTDGSISLWDIYQNQSTGGAWHFNDYLSYGEFTSDGHYLILSRPDSLEVRDSRDGSLRSRYEAVAYSLSPIDPNIVAIADKDNVIKVLELDSGQTIVNIPAHDYPIFSVAFSPDGNFLASSGEDCKIKLWDARTGEFVHYFEDTIANGYFGPPPTPTQEGDDWGNSRIFIYSMVFIPGTNQILGFGSWGTLVSWNVYSGATNYVVYSTPLEYYNGVHTVSPHYPENFFVDLSADRFYINDQSYDLQTGEMKEKITTFNTTPSCLDYGPITLDGKVKFTMGYGSLEGQVCVIDTSDNRLIRSIDVLPNADYDFYIAGLTFSEDGNRLLVATSMGTIEVYQITR